MWLENSCERKEQWELAQDLSPLSADLSQGLPSKVEPQRGYLGTRFSCVLQE